MRFILIIYCIVFSCAKNDLLIQEDLSPHFEKAKKYFDKKKYSRARDEFDYIIMAEPGSKLANRSQYFLAESMFQLEDYIEASKVYDKYIRFSSDLSKIEEARYRICQCAINSSNSFQRDQSQTKSALEQLQMFIEDFPSSVYIDDAEKSIFVLRSKLARKEYESARMYLKLEEYDSALLYFQSILNHYYDTSIADEARISIIFTHILNNNRTGAKNYFNSQSDKFLTDIKFEEAEAMLEDTKSGLKLGHYIKLYK